MTLQTVPDQLLKVLAANPQPPRLIVNPRVFRYALRDSISDTAIQYLVVEVESLSSFIAYCEVMHDALEGRRPTIFRGHANASWRLVPSLMRESFFPTLDPQSTEVEALEQELLDQFERRAMPHIRNPPQGPGARWKLAAIAQHHNLPTRFLDWTYRPTTALFFAVGFEPPKNYGGFSCVWSIQSPPSYHEVQKIQAAGARSLEGFTPSDEWPRPQLDKDLPVCIFDPPHVSPRITTQQACFTVHPSHYLRHYFNWIDGVRVIFILEAANRRDLRASLERLGINRETFFPDLDGIAAHLTEQITPKYGPVHARPVPLPERRDA